MKIGRKENFDQFSLNIWVVDIKQYILVREKETHYFLQNHLISKTINIVVKSVSNNIVTKLTKQYTQQSKNTTNIIECRVRWIVEVRSHFEWFSWWQIMFNVVFLIGSMLAFKWLFGLLKNTEIYSNRKIIQLNYSASLQYCKV